MTSWREPDSIDRGGFEPRRFGQSLNHHVSRPPTRSPMIPRGAPTGPARESEGDGLGVSLDPGRPLRHIPFCETRCSSAVPHPPGTRGRLCMDALLRELRSTRKRSTSDEDLAGSTSARNPSFVPSEIDRLARRAQEAEVSGGADIGTRPPLNRGRQPSKLAPTASGDRSISMGIQVIEPDSKVLNREAGVETPGRSRQHHGGFGG
jgi:hypothetical protein